MESLMDTTNSSSECLAESCNLAIASIPSGSDPPTRNKSPMQWKKAARRKKRKNFAHIPNRDEERWDFYRKENEVSEEVIKAWEVGRKLGLYSKCSDEEIRRQLEVMERRDRAKGNRNNRKGRKDRIGRALWGEKKWDWAYRESEGRSGGLVSIWNTKVFSKTSSWHINGMLVVNGRWVEDGTYLVIINVYAPCSFREKEQLWEAIKILVDQYEDRKICVVGDFNSIRVESERIGRTVEVDHRDINLFEEFISSSGLIDLPLRGRRFTWYKLDGTCKSRLDRILVNMEWLNWQPDLKLKGLGRTVSDHCPLILVHAI
ncbi:hypothetical protein ACS0TY_006158 [Phlomoides rotata]